MLGIRRGTSQSGFVSSFFSPHILLLCREEQTSLRFFYFAQLGLQFVRVSSFHEAVLSPLWEGNQELRFPPFFGQYQTIFLFLFQNRSVSSFILVSSCLFPPPLGALPLRISYLFCWQVSTSIRRGDVYNIFSFWDVGRVYGHYWRGQRLTLGFFSPFSRAP